MSSPERKKVDLTITPEQAEMLQQARAAAQQAQQTAAIILAAIMRGHGVTVGQLVHLRGTTLTVEVPDAGE